MAWLSFFSRKTDRATQAPARHPANEPGDSAQQARVRARRRLIGATVLVLGGIVVFPMVFETQPRPVALDIPIEIPRKDGAAPLSLPSDQTSAQAPARDTANSPAPAPRVAAPTPAPAADEVITETRAEAGREVPPPRAASAVPAAPKVATRPETPATPARPERPDTPATAAVPATPAQVARAPEPAAPADGARAQALLNGQPSAQAAANPAAARFVVQVGAFVEATAARETRMKVERLGIKTYTQVAETAGGSRIRVRVGPVASREEADKLQSRLKAAGLSAVVLTL